MWLVMLLSACGDGPGEPGRDRAKGGDAALEDTDSGAPSAGAGLGTVISGSSNTDTGPYVLPAGEAFDFVFQSGGYERSVGTTAYLALTWLHAPDQVAWTGSAVISSDGRIDETFPDVVVLGTSYVLYWYVDVDGDGACSELPVDLTWSTEEPGLWGGLGLDLGPVEGDLVVSVPANDTFDFDGCAIFDAL